MTAHIISNIAISGRYNQLLKELERQGIADYKIWPSIHIATKPRRTGISKAHKQIVEWALIEQLPEVCIMEDDVWFPANDGWKYFLANKPKETFDLYLGGITRGDIDKDGVTKRYTGQFAYVISGRFFTTFLRADENLDIDGAMSGMGVFKVCEPFACFCYPCFSENANGVMDYSHLIVGREVYGFGKINNNEDAKRFSDTAKALMI